MDTDQPPPVVHATNLGLDTPVSHRLLALMLVSVVSGLGVLYTNHSILLRWARRANRNDGGKKASHNPTIVVTDLLAAISLVNGVLAFFGACVPGMWGSTDR